MGGRFLLGFGGAVCGTAAPAYVSEIAHPSFCGAMTAVFGVFWFGGGIPGTFIPWRTSHIDGDLAWRIPVWLQKVFSGLVLIFVFTIPEVCMSFLHSYSETVGHADGSSPLVG